VRRIALLNKVFNHYTKEDFYVPGKKAAGQENDTQLKAYSWFQK
jgi:hypothetical protein